MRVNFTQTWLIGNNRGTISIDSLKKKQIVTYKQAALRMFSCMFYIVIGCNAKIPERKYQTTNNKHIRILLDFLAGPEKNFGSICQKNTWVSPTIPSNVPRLHRAMRVEFLCHAPPTNRLSKTKGPVLVFSNVCHLQKNMLSWHDSGHKWTYYII